MPPYNGSGSASAAVGGNYPAVASTLIESGKYNVLVADLLTMLSTALLKDGQQVSTARIPFAAGIQTDSVTEKTSDTGVTLDSVLLKDGRVDTMQGADIASSATLNLETATGNVVDVTGTVTVTAVTLSQGHWRLVRFTGALVLTNGASLVLPGAANFTTAAGDFVLFVGYAASVVRAYILPTSGPIPFVDSQPVVIGSADKTKKVRLEVDGLTTATTRVITVPDADGTLITSASPFTDTSAIVAGSADATKKVRFEADGLTTATTRVITMPDRDLTLSDGPTNGTQQATTSGTSIDFTGIPSWVKQIIVQFVGVSTNGTSVPLLQIGDSGGIETAGYSGAVSQMAAATMQTGNGTTAGYQLTFDNGAVAVYHGTITITLENAATFTWVATGILGRSDTTVMTMMAGSKSLSAALDRVRLTTVNGTDAFDAGALNILYS